jgi:hypothetical protein
VFGGPCGAYFGGCESIEGAVGSARVVLDSPCLDNDLGFEQRGELLDVQEFVAFRLYATLAAESAPTP